LINLKWLYLHKCVSYCNEILYSDTWHHSVHYEQLKIFINLICRTAAILNIFEPPHLCSRLRYRNDILRLRTALLCAIPKLKILIFQNPRWRTAAILNILKLLYVRKRLSYRNKILYGDAWRHTAYQQLKLRTFKIQDGGRNC